MHYDENYFNWQKNIGAFGGIANLFKFEEYIKPADVVLDFGCGGGYLLKNITASGKIGVEINDTARIAATGNGIMAVKNIEDVEDNFIDIIISNAALEHVINPFEAIFKLRNKLKDGGIACFVVPHEDTTITWHDNDINMHLYTWNQMTLGNLFKVAGYNVIKVETIRHRWPENYQEIVEKHGWQKFHKACVKYAKKVNNYQIRIVAKK